MRNCPNQIRIGTRETRRRLQAALGAAILLLASAAGETPPAATSLADLSLEQLMEVRVERVYSASKYEQKVTQAPAAVTIVTADTIRNLGARTLADILRGTRGVYVTYDRNYSNLGIRGFARPGDFNTRVLLLVDGHRMNDNLYDSALIGPEAILDVDLIERVEIIRGPSSSIYGNSAFFGVINVITRSAAQIDGTELSGGGGSFGTHRGRLTLGRKLGNDTSLVLSASVSDSDGQGRLYFREFDNVGNNGGVAENADGEKSVSLFGKLAWRDIAFSAAWSQRTKHVPTASSGTVFNDGRERTEDERLFADLQFRRALAGAGEIMARAYYDRYAYAADYPLNFGAPSDPAFLSHDDHNGEGVGAEIQWTQPMGDRHTAVAGAEWRRSLHLFQSSFTDDPRSYSFLDKRRGSSVGVYLQDEFRLRTGMILNAGLRYDHFDNFGDTFNPRLGIIYSPREQTTFKLLYGRAYRAPNAYELYLESPFYSKSNPELRPETIQTYEAVFEQYLPHNLRFGVSTYYYAIGDLISQEFDSSDGLLVFRNVDSVRARGVELELESKSAAGPVARASYALQRSEDGETGEELNNSPRHLVRASVALPLFRSHLTAGAEIQYTGSLKTLDGNRTAGFAIVNLTLAGAAPVHNLEVSATVYNVLDRAYAYPGSTGHVQDAIPQDGRTFRLQMTCRF